MSNFSRYISRGQNKKHLIKDGYKRVEYFLSTNNSLNTSSPLIKYLVRFFSLGPSHLWVELDYLCVFVYPSTLRRWSMSLLVGLTDPCNHTYSESLWWKLFKNRRRKQIQIQRQWQRQQQRQRQSAWNTQHILYFQNPDDSLIPNMMIDT